MKWRTQLPASALILFGFILLMGCNKSRNEIVPTPTTTTPTVAMRADNPFAGTVIYKASFTYDLPCDCKGFMPVGTYVGTGNLTHLGLITSNIKPCVSPTAYGYHVAVECGSFIAANGDELYCDTAPYDLYWGADGASGAIIVTFSGGTGRFAEARGSFTGIISIDALGNGKLDNINGTINY